MVNIAGYRQCILLQLQFCGKVTLRSKQHTNYTEVESLIAETMYSNVRWKVHSRLLKYFAWNLMSTICNFVGGLRDRRHGFLMYSHNLSSLPYQDKQKIPNKTRSLQCFI